MNANQTRAGAEDARANRAANLPSPILHLPSFIPHLQPWLLVICGLAASAGARADALVEPNPKIKIKPVVKIEARAFPLQNMRLLDGPFKHAMELDEKYLLS